MFQIRIQQNREAVTIALEGRLAGSSVKKLNRVWMEFAPQLGCTPLTIDLRHLTRADAYGVKALRNLQSLTGAKLITTTPLTRYVAEDVARGCALSTFRRVREAVHGRSRLQARYGTI
jgi:ABC-type transporter Mla MlaB component